MRDTDLMQLALGLIPPWMVKACAFDAEARRLDIEIDFARGGRFPCPQCGTVDCPVARHGDADVATSRLLPASGVPALPAIAASSRSKAASAHRSATACLNRPRR
jgi:hypothetical protein